ncbi:hypothetical protein SBV1_3240011 [Verrucomicrobia bacterium]|nr:hypothetical protein SBV1_3240011 [Verrucomicrobiota bacterium]
MRLRSETPISPRLAAPASPEEFELGFVSVGAVWYDGFEFRMDLMNPKLNKWIETIFMKLGDAHTFLGSRILREIARFSGEVRAFVPPHVQAALAEHCSQRSEHPAQKGLYAVRRQLAPFRGAPCSPGRGTLSSGTGHRHAR